jgi:hypothetical protein
MKAKLKMVGFEGHSEAEVEKEVSDFFSSKKYKRVHAFSVSCKNELLFYRAIFYFEKCFILKKKRYKYHGIEENKIEV